MKTRISVLAVASALFAAVPQAWALGPAPSWQLNQGAVNTCDSSGFNLPGVEINVPTGQASEQGVLSAPGFPNLGHTQDTAFGPFVGPSSFFVFVDTPYTLPPNTPLTLSVTTYHGTNYTGGVAYVSTITWNCTTGAVIAQPTAVPVLAPAALGALALGLFGLGAVGRRRWSRSR